MAKRPDWDICKQCTHTVNSHTTDGVVGACHAYKCECEGYQAK